MLPVRKFWVKRLSPVPKHCIYRQLILKVDDVFDPVVSAAAVPLNAPNTLLVAVERAVNTKSPLWIPLEASVRTLFQSAVVIAVVDDLEIVALGLPLT